MQAIANGAETRINATVQNSRISRKKYYHLIILQAKKAAKTEQKL